MPAVHVVVVLHAAVDPQTRRQNGLTDGLIRLSVGLEDVDDLIADLERGLAAVQGSAAVTVPAETGGHG